MGSPRTSEASRWQLFRKLTRRDRRSKREREREKDRGDSRNTREKAKCRVNRICRKLLKHSRSANFLVISGQTARLFNRKTLTVTFTRATLFVIAFIDQTLERRLSLI